MNNILPKIKRSQKNDKSTSSILRELIYRLSINHVLTENEYLYILDNITEEETDYLFSKGYEAKLPYYQNRVYLRGLIEISNYCKMGCKYCGLNYKMKDVKRYRMSKDEILLCAAEGYLLGYRTFVIQGGEDSFYTDDFLVDLVITLKEEMKDIRITLSLGERNYDSYKMLKEAGVDRYLLRHETASIDLYRSLHADFMSFDNRRKCLSDLKRLNYQVGAGFMVGSPSQNNSDLVKDLLYLKELEPHMIGIGPYICHSDTELCNNDSGTLIETLIMLALVRLTFPKVLLPATTALGTLDKQGREKALKVGANVMMSNISPSVTRNQYEIYQNKICTSDTSVQCRGCIELRIKAFGHEVDLSVGDYVDFEHYN